VGLYTYESSASNLREFVGTQLSSALTVGTKYYVAFKANLAIDTNHVFTYATNNLGVRFSTVPYSFSNPEPVNNSAQIFDASVITDTLGWTIVKGSFIADSAYRYVAIGNFFDDSHTAVVYVQDTLYDISAYYYIDDVYVSTDSLDGIDTHTVSNALNIFPNPATDYFTVQIPGAPAGQEALFTVYDVLGKTVDEERGSFSEGKYLLYRNGMRSGVYMLKIETGGRVYYRRIVVQ